MAKAKKAYDEKAIQTLDPLAHIRLRPGMYIGRLGMADTHSTAFMSCSRKWSITRLMNLPGRG